MIRKFTFLAGLVFLFLGAEAQYKSFKISPRGDTLNRIDQNGLKQGPWVIHVDPLRGERGYEEEGYFVDDKKEGAWRKYTLAGDFIALENYLRGDKDGKSKYFSPFGELLREESWRAYDPAMPYDTIPIYGENSGQIISYKIIKAEPYSVKDGEWTYYDSQTGRVLKTEVYDRGHLVPSSKTPMFVKEEPMKKIKPQEVLDYEKKNAGKKKVKVRDGRTSN
ncbi:MAG: hypothetical protein J5I50_09275 [Chitinophagaceae bacterium]|nr:hypothetical protein [Chitinophagaceae bacterium]